MNVLNILLRAALAALLLAAGVVQAQQTCPAGLPLTTPDSDFADAGNGAVRHIPTGLIWKRCAEGQTWNGSTCTGTAASYMWQEAFQRADAVNAGAPGTQNAGQADWRLPNQKELRSIVERACYNPSINAAQFPATSASYFWSGSPVAGYSDYAWDVGFLNGNDSWNVRDYSYQVRLVRAGQYFYNFDAAATPATAATITSGPPPGGTVGVPYSFTVTASGTAPIAFAATGLPPGLSIDPASGAISGTPTTGGSYSVTITATNAGGTATQNATMAIAGAATPASIPTLSEWGLIVLSLLLAGMAALRWRRG